MAQFSKLNLNVTDIMRQNSSSLYVTVKLEGVKRFRFRLWITTQLIRLAGFISPIRVTLET